MKLDDRGIKNFFTFIGIMTDDGVIRGRAFSSPSACGVGGCSSQDWLDDYARVYNTEKAISDCLLGYKSIVSSGTFEELVGECSARKGALIIYRGEGHWEMYWRGVKVTEV